MIDSLNIKINKNNKITKQKTDYEEAQQKVKQSIRKRTAKILEKQILNEDGYLENFYPTTSKGSYL